MIALAFLAGSLGTAAGDEPSEDTPRAPLQSTGETLRIEEADFAEDGTIFLRWSGPDRKIFIERTLSLDPPDWHLLPGVIFPILGNEWEGRLSDPSESGFFRIRSTAETSPAEVTTWSSSPADGEQGVAVTRETVLRFSRPLDSDRALASDAVAASFGGERLEVRRHVSADRRRLSLFYEEPLPASAQVRVRVDGDALVDDQGQPIDGDGDGEPGGEGEVRFRTLSLTTLPGTAVVGRVFASELATDANGEQSVNVPLQGATITVDGKEETLRTVTDENGNFRLDPAPAGRFFVHIDGRTAVNSTPDGAYYPYVGKAWEAEPGEETNVGDVYLPLIPEDTLQPVSETEETVVTFPDSVVDEHPDLEGVEVRVPPDSLYSDDGSRGGQVGIAPVPPDRLPGELPPGLDFPLVITVQTDGPTNFDEPVAACFPNLPDPDTGERLDPGEKSALWSFNHDTGRFEIVGSMTVSDDGERICTDEGVGIPAPGWHGTNPGSPPGPADPPEQPCEVDAQSCAPSAILGGMECALSFIPLAGGIPDAAGCAFGATRAGLSVLRDVPTGDGADAAIGVSTGAAGTAASCIGAVSKAVPALGTAISCGGATISIAKNCTCIGRSTAPEGLQALSGDDHPAYRLFQSDAIIASMEANIALLEAYRDFYTVLLGAEVWTDAIDLSSGDPRRQSEHMADFLEALYDRMGEESDEAQLLSDAEAAELRAMPRPGKLTDGDVDELVDYLNRTTIMWRQGVLTHEEADRSDFMDHSQYTAAVDGIEMALDHLQGAQGASDDDPMALESPFQQIHDLLIDGWGASGLPKFEVEGLYYVLVDETNDFVQRGRMTGEHRFEQRALRGDAFYRVELLDPETFALGRATFESASAGETTPMPRLALHPTEGMPDSDGDGLPDAAELIVGTDPDNPDTSGDGVDDATAVRQGVDPLGGRRPGIGIRQSTDTPGEAVDVSVRNDLAVVADGDAGIALFNIFNGMSPTLMTQLATPGRVNAVAGGDEWVVAADSRAGVLIVDVSDPTDAGLAHEISVRGEVRAVATAGEVAYAGTSMGELVAIDPVAGEKLYQVVLPGPHVQDLVPRGDFLYVLTEESLYTMSLPGLELLDETGSTGRVGLTAGDQRLRLFVGESVAYAVHSSGVNTFSLDDPARPERIAHRQTGQLGWKQIVVNDAARGVAAVGANPGDDGDHHISLYDVSDPSEPDVFLTEIPTPGIARAVTLYKGEAYVADGEAGLQVVRYMELDTDGNAPEVSLTSDSPDNRLIVGGTARLSAAVEDDIQVSRVELYRDVERVTEVGTFPFESRFRVEGPSGGTTVYQARAIDSGGNATWSEELEASRVEDDQPPKVRITRPRAGSLVPQASDSFEVEVVATDHVGVREIAFELDGQSVAASEVGPDRFRLTTPSPGRHTVEATAEDEAGLMGRSEAIEIEVTDAGSSDAEGIQFDQPIVGGADALPREYLFRAEAGQKVFAEVQASSFESGSAPNWRLVAEDGQTLFDRRVAEIAQPGPVTLASGGTYTIVVGEADESASGAYRLQLSSIPPADEFALSIGEVVEEGTPGPGAGRIESAGAVDLYRFDAEAGDRFFFEVLEGPAIDWLDPLRWQLTAPDGRVVFRELVDPFTFPGRIRLSQTGEYTIRVGDEASRTTGSYSIHVWPWPPSEGMPIAIGDEVSEGVPQEGAGRIEVANEMDVYRFTASPGQTIFLEVTEFDFEGGLLFPIQWVLEHDASGEIVLEEFVTEFFSGGRMRLEEGGEYTLTVGSRRSDETGAYGFHLWDVPPADTFDIALGETVAAGNPGPGAGEIETPGVRDRYRFDATEGEKAFFEVLATNFEEARLFDFVDWRLISPSGEDVFHQLLTERVHPGRMTFEETGEYEMVVGSDRAPIAGTYSVRIGRPETEEFAIEMGDTIAEDQPAPGAGRIDEPGGEDIYRFEASQGDTVFFEVLSADLQGREDNRLLFWQLLAPSGDEVFEQMVAEGVNPGRITLEESGTYEIRVGSDSFAVTGTYSLRLGTPGTTEYGIEIGDTIAEDDPAAGAGRIDEPGDRDIYRFTVAAGDRAFIEVRELAFSFIDMRLEDPDGEAVFDSQFLEINHPAPIRFEQDGDYRLIVGSEQGDYTGAYSLKVWDVPEPDIFDIALGETIAEGIPGPGAGNVESPGAEDIYRFNGEAGESVKVEILSPGLEDGFDFEDALLPWRIEGPDGSRLAQGSVFAFMPTSPLELPETGQYQLVVGGGSNAAVGAYSLEIRRE